MSGMAGVHGTGPADGGAVQLVFMGVSGCGKSSLAQAVARRLGWPLIEGDDFHPPANVEKMRQGIALDDADRSGWLDELARQLAVHRSAGRPAVLTCSALKRRYREQLRQASPGLGFVFLELEPAQALARVAGRPDHLFPPSLVSSQFATLESPVGEAGVLRVDATVPTQRQVAAVLDWLHAWAGPRRGFGSGTWFASAEQPSEKSPMSDKPRETASVAEPSAPPNESVETVGSHPLGTAAGALGGAATGAVIGIAAGPLGSLVGAVGGAILGGAAGAGGGSGPEVPGADSKTDAAKP